MKFEDKLIDLRKKKGLSQEQLAEKLDVARQTVSKWELGQSKPDMDKLKLMSELYGINIDDLIKEEATEIKRDTHVKKEGTRKYILYIVIVLFIACIGTLGYRLFSSKSDEEKTGIFGIFDSIIGPSEFEITKFNNSFESNSGETSAFFLESMLTDLITSNKKNTNHQIELVYNGISYGTDTTKIQEIKNSISDDYKYDVMFDYDEEGFINKCTISLLKQDVSISTINSSFEVFAGECYGTTVERKMSDLITNNKKYADHQIELIFDGVSYGTDTDAISNKKNTLDTWTQYDLSFEYDEKGYINKFIVVTK